MYLNIIGASFIFLVLCSGTLQAMGIENWYQMIDDIETTFTNFYAPKCWKETYCGWNLAMEIDKLKKAAAESSDSTRFQEAIKRFFQATRDYHTSVRFTNTASSSLPISIMYVKGKFYLAYIADSLKANFPLELGDIITHIGNKETRNLALELMGNIDQPSLTDWAKAARKLTQRIGIMGDPIAHGSVVIKAEHEGKNVIAQLAWDYNPNLLDECVQDTNTSIKFNNSSSQTVVQQFKPHLEKIVAHIEERPFRVLLNDFWQQPALETAANPLTLGKKEGFLPKLGERVVWETSTESHWQAYIYINEDKKLIGVIRIPTYAPDSGSLAKSAEEFGEIIARMENLTEAVVIDQLNNPGGDIFYLYALASMLTDKPLSSPRHRFTIDSKSAWEAQNLLKHWDSLLTLSSQTAQHIGNINGYPIDHQFLVHMKNYFQFIVEQWKANKTFTDAYFLYGVDYIQPHPHHEYRYTKKIVLLINELDFSGGDFFPSILQDNDRAILMGTRTAGAGGYILTDNERNLVGIHSYTYTGSLAYRIDESPIENLGITPNIPYQVTQEDLMKGFQPFKNAINSVLKQILE
jgi:C-terminal processing protease CtpA/Prc